MNDGRRLTEELARTRAAQSSSARDPSPRGAEDGLAALAARPTDGALGDTRVSAGAALAATADGLGTDPTVLVAAGGSIEVVLETMAGGPASAPPTARGGAASAGVLAKIGRYTVIKKLGEGGMGEVFSAYDDELDRRVAIKLVREQRAADTIGQARMQREAQAMARLSHPNVVQIYDVGLHGGQVFIAMEFVRGLTLEQWQGSIDRRSSAGLAQIVAMYVQAGEGLAAAHAAGLVHRDFKPENVLVGEDGRARVLDFGIAGAAGPGAGSPVEGAGGGGLLSSELTRTGSVMGTPAFMAPEQFMAQPTDARTDQFSFCVSLYSALYGEEAFGGETFGGRQAAVCEGEIAPAPEGAIVPAWLREVLLRGLQVEPEARFPSMTALLAALLADPEAARRRRLRAVGVVVAAVLVSSLVMLAALWGWSSMQRRAGEAAAMERLRTMERAVMEREGAGDEAEAARIFEAFVRAPANQGTPALTQAWLGGAARATARGDSGGAVDAYAASYSVARSKEHQVAALAGLTRFLRERMRWRGMQKSIAALEAVYPEVFTDEAEAWAAARVQASMIRGDLAGAEALVAAMPSSPLQARTLRIIRALTPAHQASVEASSGLFEAVGDRVVLATEEEARWFDRGVEMRERSRYPLPITAAQFVTAPAGSERRPLLIGLDADRREGVLLALDEGAWTELLRWQEEIRPLSSFTADLDGDGVGAIYVGTGPYTRRVFALHPPVAGDPARSSWRMESAAPMIGARRSDVNSLFVEDLDGDGAMEVVAALGAWRAYELHALRYEASTGTLRTIARHRLGNASAAPFRGSDGAIRIAAWKHRDSVDVSALPPSAAREPAGLRSFGFVEDRFVPLALHALPSESEVRTASPLVGDLDGDGLDELVVRWRSEEEHPSDPAAFSTLVMFEDDAGGFVTLPILEVMPVAVLDVDGDGDDEVLVRRGGAELWTLGAGEGRLPRLMAVEQVAAPRGWAHEATLGWARASELAAMGLERQAVAAFARLAESSAEPGAAALALRRGAELAETLRDDRRAAELWQRAAELHAAGDLAEEAGLRAIEAHLRRGDQAAARAIAWSTQGLAEAALVSPTPPLELTFTAALDRRWQIFRPLMPRRVAARGALRIEGTGQGEIMALPMTWHEGQVVVDVEIDLRRVDWGQTLRVEIAAAEQEGSAGVLVSGGGGGGAQWLQLGCDGSSREMTTKVPIDVLRLEAPGQHRLRVSVDPGRQEVSCTVWGPDGAEIFYARVDASRAALKSPGSLRISTQGQAGSVGWVSADLMRVRIEGATLASAAAELPLAEARHALVEGRLTDVLVAIDSGTATAMTARSPELRALAGFWRVSALSRLSRWPEAVAALRPLITDPALAEVIEGPLTHLLRVEPETTIPLLRATGGDHRARVARAWSTVLAVRRRDPTMLEVLYRALVDLEEETRRPALELAELYSFRAAVHFELGMFERARRDYAGAISLVEDARGAGAEERVWREDTLRWKVEAAAAALREGDAEGAWAVIEALLAVPEQEAFVRDVIEVREEFAPFRGR